MTSLTKFEEVKQQKLLELVSKGMTITKALAEMGEEDQIFWRWIQSNNWFRKELDTAEVIACQPLEDVLYRKAMDGNIECLKFWLINRSPVRWKSINNNIINNVINEVPPEQLLIELERIVNHVDVRESDPKNNTPIA